MARGGNKFPLIVYKHILNRWWTPMIAMGLGMFGIAYGQYMEPLGPFLPRLWMPFVVIGVLSILIGIFFLIIRHIAYVQAFPGYLKFVTPFLRMNISYRRIHKTTPVEMRQLFPPQSMSSWMREIFAPLASQTALIVELKGYPISPVILRMFLSRFFFKDKTTHLVILVQDWMKLSSELDSLKSGVDPNPPPAKKRQSNSILSRLPKK